MVTVRNCVRNLRRGPAAHEQTIAEEGRAILPDLAPGPVEAAEQAEAIAAVRRALLALPADDHDILLLQYAQELPMAQIAAGLHPTRRARKPLRVAVAAAACTALLTMGARRCGRKLSPLSSRTVS